MGDLGDAVRKLRPTASGLEVLANCPGSAALPRVREINHWASRGTAIHRWIELTTQAIGEGMDREDAAASALEQLDVADRAAVAGIDISALPMEGLAAEVAIGWDVTTHQVRELGRSMSRADYLRSLRPTEIGGIIDALGMDNRGVAHVIDYKTGWGEHDPGSWQQRCYAFMASKLLSTTDATTQIVRIHKGDPWHSSVRHWDAFDLLSVRSDIEAAIERAGRAAEAGVGDYSLGPHCRYCPSARLCPAQTEQVRALANLDPETQLAPKSLGEMGAVWRRLDIAEQAVKRLRGDIRRLAQSTPIPVGPLDAKGRRKYLGEVSQTRDKLDGDATYQHLATRYGPEAAEMVAPPAPREAKLGDLDKLARAMKDQGKFTTLREAKEALRAELHESGAATRSHTMIVKEYSATPCPVCGEGQATDKGPCGDCEVTQ